MGLVQVILNLTPFWVAHTHAFPYQTNRLAAFIIIIQTLIIIQAVIVVRHGESRLFELAVRFMSEIGFRVDVNSIVKRRVLLCFLYLAINC